MNEAIADTARSIELGYENFGLYSVCGFSWFCAGEYEKAIKNLRQAIALGDDGSDFEQYGRLFILLSRCRISQAKEAAQELREHVQDVSETDEKAWFVFLARHLLGESEPKILLEAAKDLDPEKALDRLCGAHFYIGQRYLLDGNMEKAKASFRAVLATHKTGFAEYTASKFELERLEFD